MSTPASISNFHIFIPPDNVPIPVYQPGKILSVPSKSLYEKMTKHPFLCIPSLQLTYYGKWVWRCWKEADPSKDEDFWDKVAFEESLNVPLSASFKDFRFLEVCHYESGSLYLIKIKTVFDASAIFNYRIRQNLITDDRFFRLGIFKKVFDLIPAGFHYYDLSYVCTCGEPGCDHVLALFMKEAEGGCCVPFVIDKSDIICFDLNHRNKLNAEYTPAEMEKISHKDYEDNPESNGSVYPFYLKRDDFRINPYTLKPNKYHDESMKMDCKIGAHSAFILNLIKLYGRSLCN